MYIREGEYDIIFPNVHIGPAPHFRMQRIIERIFVVGSDDPEEDVFVVDGGNVFKGQGVVDGIAEGDGLELFAVDFVLDLSVGCGEQFLGGFVEVVDEVAVVGEEGVL